MIYLYRYFCGVLRVEFFGIYPEKVLNLCAKNGIYIWSARYVKQKIECKIGVRDFFRLRKILRKSGVRVHILEKKGFPFFVKKYNKRFGIFAGLIIFLAFLQIMSGHIWVIEVAGNKTVTGEEILENCKALGIVEGVKKTKISPKADAQELLLMNDKLAWGSFNIEGCVLTVDVTEITEKQGGTAASNLVATQDGIIEKIDVKSGNCVVKVGEVVKQGDILVSGIIEGQNGTSFVCSRGEIFAKTSSEIVLKEKLYRQEIIPNGKTKAKRVLEIFTLKIPLYLGGESGTFTTEKTVYTASLFGKKIPIRLYTKRFVFVNKHAVKTTPEQATKRLLEKVEGEYGEKIKTKNVVIEKDVAVLKAQIVENKNIAKSENIIIDLKEDVG